MGHPFWPLFDLRLRTERLELRVPADDDLPALVAAVDAGIHDPAEMPFTHPWTDGEPLERARRSAQFWWGQRANWSADDWDLGLMVVHGGRPVGMQSISAQEFGVLRTVATGSWLTQRVQGRGLGREMRAAVLHLAFAGLGADVACSGAMVHNTASIRVSESLGYVDDGLDRAAPRGRAVEVRRFRLSRAAWEGRPRPGVTVENLEPCLPLFGAG